MAKTWEREREEGNWVPDSSLVTCDIGGSRRFRLLKVCQVEKEMKREDGVTEIMYANGVSLKLSGRVKRKEKKRGC